MNPIPRLVPTADELLIDSDPQSPLGILQAQSAYVEDLTQGKVTSNVYFYGSGENEVSFSFHLISTATRFHVSIFTLHVGKAMDYPVRISAPNSMDSTLDTILVSEPEFLECVKSIFRSPKSIDTFRKLSWHT